MKKSLVNLHLAVIHKRKITGKQIFSNEHGGISELRTEVGWTMGNI